MATAAKDSKKKGSPKKVKTGAGIKVKVGRGLSKRSMSKSSAMGNRFIIKDDETKPVQFLTGPKEFAEFEIHNFRHDGVWNFVPCVDECPLCKDDSDEVRQTRFRFAVNVYSLKDKKVLIMEGPKDLALRILNKYERKPASFTKRVFDITRYASTPTTYQVERAEEQPVQTKNLKLFDLNAYVQQQADRYYGPESDGLDDEEETPAAASTSLDEDDDEDEDQEVAAEADEDDDDLSDEDEDDDDLEDDDDDDQDDDEEDEDEEEQVLDRVSRKKPGTVVRLPGKSGKKK